MGMKASNAIATFFKYLILILSLIHILIQRLTEGDGLEHDKADDPGDQVDQTLPLIQELLCGGTPESCLLYTSRCV